MLVSHIDASGEPVQVLLSESGNIWTTSGEGGENFTVVRIGSEVFSLHDPAGVGYFPPTVARWTGTDWEEIW